MEQRQNYHGYLGYQWARRVAESRFMRGKNVRFPRMCEAYFFLFQTGAVIGRAMSTRATELAELFAEPGRAADLARWFPEAGKSLVEEIPSISSTTLYELAVSHLGLEFGVQGGVEGIHQHPDKWVPFEDAAQSLGGAVMLGVCLGITYASVVEQAWRAREAPDEMRLAVRRELGLPEEWEPLSLQEFEQHALFELAAFVRAYYPHLVGTLGLAIPGAG